ncbi:MAG TPA: tRNA (adenosine(37)-N6)-threonylcarbamoyltransferase complex transferase subunit TsaD [Fimbriimonadaceae bacterium]|nr:tRNA (adenosine(37)-N6)-threonylcarbamoyltransferase complex transferase subunit TsaD [Fimbriimonadaceae bacterium]
MSEPTILAIETSCDETSVAITKGRRILANIVSSQANLHRQWGGVVPEAAARAHVEAVLPTLSLATTSSGVALAEVDIVAVTNRPGLVGALSVGVSAAKALAYTLDRPILPIHHLEGHVLSTLTDTDLTFPHVCLAVSGGHTEMILVHKPGHYESLGSTIDDAAGEAFDKSARLLGLSYPGGYELQELARTGNASRYDLPRGLKGETTNFSFSGLKTAVLRLVQVEGSNLDRPSAAASIQRAIVTVLVERTVAAAERLGVSMVTLVGGVAANESLRETLSAEATRAGIRVVVPPRELCTDNAAMIGLAASTRVSEAHRNFQFETVPSASLT